VTASGKMRDINAVKLLHPSPFARKLNVVSDLAGLLAWFELNTFPLMRIDPSTVVLKSADQWSE